MKVVGAISIAAASLYFWDQDNFHGYYATNLGRMLRSIGASFGF
jgi:hypothetical protein